MRLTRTFIAATSITLVLLVALLAVLLATQRSFGYHSWPTAREAAPRDQAVAVDAPIVKTPAARAAAPDRARTHAAEDAPQLVAVAPQGQTSPLPRAAVEPAAPANGEQPDPAQAETAPAEELRPQPQPADEPALSPVPSLPAVGLPARGVPDLPGPNLPEPIEPELDQIGDGAPPVLGEADRPGDQR
jgi:hypothetical protein